MNYKKVSLYKLERLRKLIVLSKLDNLLSYFDNEILEVENKDVNSVKKMIYNDMQRYRVGTKENRQLYELYQDLKNGLISKDNALSKFMSIGVD